MRVAVALFQHEISPRYCCAPSVDILEWDGRAVTHELMVELGTMPYPDRLELLARMGVSVLLCGAFPCAQKPLADRLGIAVVCGLCGEARTVRARLGEILASVRKPCDPN
jgi:hypothetical protein